MGYWIGVAIIGYLFVAVARVMDKVLLSRAIPNPLVFAFYTGLLSGLSLFLFPFGVELVTWRLYVLTLGGGVAFLAGLYCLYKALARYEISRVVWVILSIGPFLTFLGAHLILGYHFDIHEGIGVLLLIAGGVLVSWEAGTRNLFHGPLLLYAFLASVFASVSFILTKEAFLQTSFINGFVWTRLGIFTAALFLLLLPSTRAQLRKRNPIKIRHWTLFGINKAVGGSAFFFINLALKHGDIATVHALGSFEYFFVFIISFVLSFLWPSLLKEDFSLRTVTFKFSGAVMLIAAIRLLSIDI